MSNNNDFKRQIMADSLVDREQLHDVRRARCSFPGSATFTGFEESIVYIREVRS